MSSSEALPPKAKRQKILYFLDVQVASALELYLI